MPNDQLDPNTPFVDGFERDNAFADPRYARSADFRQRVAAKLALDGTTMDLQAGGQVSVDANTGTIGEPTKIPTGSITIKDGIGGAPSEFDGIAGLARQLSAQEQFNAENAGKQQIDGLEALAQANKAQVVIEDGHQVVRPA